MSGIPPAVEALHGNGLFESVDWPARFRAAADAADAHTRPQLARFLRDVAYLWPYLPAATAEAIGRALLGGDP